MKRVLLLFLAACLPACRPSPPPAIRAAAIGGMTSTGLWQEIARRFEARSGHGRHPRRHR